MPCLICIHLHVQIRETIHEFATKDHGHHFIGPDDGSLACGEYGSGRLVDPSEILKQLS